MSHCHSRGDGNPLYLKTDLLISNLSNLSSKNIKALILPCSISSNKIETETHAFVDSGGNDIGFIDTNFAQKHNLDFIPLTTPRVLRVVDGRKSSSGMVTHTVTVTLTIENHHEIVKLFVTKLGQYPLILGYSWLSRHNPSINWQTNSVIFDSPFCQKSCQKSKLDLLSAETSHRELLSEENKNLLSKLPPWLHHQLPAFSKVESRILPPHRPTDHKIVLKKGAKPPFGRLYSMSREELAVLREWLQDNLAKGFIRPSTSPAASPVLFVKKSDGKLRLCMDYRALNAITVKNRYPIPLISETLDRLSQAKYFTKLDVISAFNRIRIHKGDEWKTAFRTRYGLFESLVMPFGLTNAPSTFQSYINSTLQEHLDNTCTAFLDDVLIDGTTRDDHRRQVNIVVEKLQKAGLQLDIDKCKFEASEVKYLGLIISRKGIEMDPQKVECIKSWKTPSCIKDIQAFLGFANFYRRFIKSFSKIALPLTELTKKNVPWSWSQKCDDAFNSLKDSFIQAPILKHFDPDRRCYVEVDSSDWAHGGILSQYGDDHLLHPIAYFSGRLTPAQVNYEIYDKELLAVVTAFEHWRAELQGTSEPVSVISDHKNLEYFMTTKTLNRRQARWSEFLSRFNFVISYRPGKLGAKPDALTRRSEDLPTGQEDERLRQQRQTVLKTHNLDPKIIQNMESSLNLATMPLEIQSVSESIERLIAQGYQEDIALQSHIRTLEGPSPHRSKYLDLSRCSIRHGRLFFDNLIYVPDIADLKLLLIKNCHDHPSGGHHGRNKIYAELTRDYWWPNMLQIITQYTKNCHTCKRITPSRLKYQGLLKQLPVPERRWRDISVDFIGPLPESEGQNCIMVVCCRLTKARHFIPCKTTTDAAGMANLFYHHIWKHHGFPESIVSDRGPQFVAQFWNAICERTNTKILLSTAWHPETDGQTERFNGILECYLRAYCNYQQNDWVQWLPSAEFNANNSESETTKVTPFFANSAQHPRTAITPPRNLDPSCVSNHISSHQTLANHFIEQMNNLNEFLRENMKASQAFYEKHANRKRSIPPAYSVGDRVFVVAKNIRTKRPSKKLDWKNLGPFMITKVVSSHSYQLQLPDDLRSIHPVFHTSILRPDPNNPIPGQTNDPNPPVEVDDCGENLYEVDAILGSRRQKSRGFEYLVKYTGQFESSWQPLSDIVSGNLSEVLNTYHKNFPRRPKPTPKELTQAAKIAQYKPSINSSVNEV